MPASQKVTIGGTDAAPTATLAEATLGDIATTVLSSNEAVTGMYGLVQKLGLAAAGAAVQNMRLTGSLNFFKSR